MRDPPARANKRPLWHNTEENSNLSDKMDTLIGLMGDLVRSGLTPPSKKGHSNSEDAHAVGQ